MKPKSKSEPKFPFRFDLLLDLRLSQNGSFFIFQNSWKTPATEEEIANCFCVHSLTLY